MRVEVSDVCLCYGGKTAVSNVSFELVEGDYLCIVGSNGSGKTTLMRGLLGLHKLSSGEIVLDGIAHNQIGYLPQQTTVKRDFPASCYEVVLSGCLNRRSFMPTYSAADKQRAQMSMQRLGVLELKNRPFNELSGGQKQRVLVARALCATTKLLVLDEPLAGIDPDAAAEMYEVLNRLNKDDGLTVLMITHDITGALRYCNKVLHMNTASEFFGSAAEYRDYCAKIEELRTC